MIIRDINELIETGDSLKQIAQAYGEIALLEIKKIRLQVESNRQFFAEIAKVYRIVRQQAALKKIVLPKKKKNVSLLLTSNYRFSGNIDADLIRFFIATSAKIVTDRIVIGKTGHEYLNSIRYFHLFLYQQFASDLPNSQELAVLADLIKDYNRVLVFFPQLSTIFIQNPTVSDITQSSYLYLQSQEREPVESYVIFEPEIAKIMQFFDSQINILLLNQSFFEAELARTGARVLSMDQAQVEANKFIGQNKKLLAKTLRTIESNRLLENVSKILSLRKLASRSGQGSIQI